MGDPGRLLMEPCLPIKLTASLGTVQHGCDSIKASPHPHLSVLHLTIAQSRFEGVVPHLELFSAIKAVSLSTLPIV